MHKTVINRTVTLPCVPTHASIASGWIGLMITAGGEKSTGNISPVGVLVRFPMIRALFSYAYRVSRSPGNSVLFSFPSGNDSVLK
jgi:hypothetical protein